MPAAKTARARLMALLAARGPGRTLCPSEVARDLAGTGGDWRALMAVVHRAADALVANGSVMLTWRGRPLARRDGPYRIGSPE